MSTTWQQDKARGQRYVSLCSDDPKKTRVGQNRDATSSLERKSKARFSAISVRKIKKLQGSVGQAPEKLAQSQSLP